HRGGLHEPEPPYLLTGGEVRAGAPDVDPGTDRLPDGEGGGLGEHVGLGVELEVVGGEEVVLGADVLGRDEEVGGQRHRWLLRRGVARLENASSRAGAGRASGTEVAPWTRPTGHIWRSTSGERSSRVPSRSAATRSTSRVLQSRRGRSPSPGETRPRRAGTGAASPGVPSRSAASPASTRRAPGTADRAGALARG